jgi:hypothetical protein
MTDWAGGEFTPFDRPALQRIGIGHHFADQQHLLFADDQLLGQLTAYRITLIADPGCSRDVQVISKPRKGMPLCRTSSRWSCRSVGRSSRQNRLLQ